MGHIDQLCTELVTGAQLPLLLIRHGQTAWNVQRRFLGRSDIALDETGVHQAELVGAALEGVALAGIYSSPLKRAWQTAEAICRGRDLDIQAVADLTELDQGELEGRPGASLQELYPKFYQQWAADPTDARVPGGETLGECQGRAVAAIEKIAQRHQPQAAVAIVTHQMVLASLICAFRGDPLSGYSAVSQGNTAVNVVGVREGVFSVRLVNETGHLGSVGA